MGQHLGIGFGDKPMSVALERGPQCGGILDDAVVYQCQTAAAVGVRMRIAAGGCAMGGPAGGRKAAAAGEGLAPQQFVQTDAAPGELAGRDSRPVLYRQARRVVAAVLEAA